MTGHDSLPPQALSEMIGQAKMLVALTGAGLSTSAGIPDFRGPNGLYVTRRYDPIRVFEIDWFRRAPQNFYEFARDFATMAEMIQPTFSHRFLHRLEAKGVLAGIVTQNIDLLHQKAGSEKVIELHGSFQSATCLGCGQRFLDLTYSWWLEIMDNSLKKPIAQCACGSLLKPDIVFFGEQVRQYDEAEALIRNCDLLLVLGSSLNVTPASQLPYETRAPTVIINRGEIILGAGENRFKVDADLDWYLRKVAEHLGPD